MKQTIKLNHRKHPWHEGMTVSSLKAENNFEFANIIVLVNGAIVEEEAWAGIAIAAGDKVEMIHIFGGG